MADTARFKESAQNVPPSIENSLRPFLLGCCILFVVLEALGLNLTRDLSRSPDFRALYAAGYLVRHQPSHLFDLAAQKQVQDTLISPGTTLLPFYHPSYEALFFAPLSMLPFRTAYLSFIGLNVLLLVAIVLASRPLFFRSVPVLQPRPGMIFFLFAPLTLAILQGQDSVLFLLICACVWKFLEQGSDLAAGALLALGLFRLQLALPLAVLLIIRRGWRFALAFGSASLTIVLLCLAISGWAGANAFFDVLRGASLSGDQSTALQNAMGIHPLAAPNLAGLLAAMGTNKLPARSAFMTSALASTVIFLVAAVRVHAAKALSTAFSIALICSLLVSQHANPHDATVLLIPVALLIAPPIRYLLLISYFLPALLLLFAGVNTFYLLAIPLVLLLCFPYAEGKAAMA